MASIFEEIASLDRPFVPVTMNFGGKLQQWQARRPNSLEADAIDAYYSDEYAKLILQKTEPGEPTADYPEGTPSELEQMREILSANTRESVIGQLMNTRVEDIKRATASKIDFNPTDEAAAFIEMTKEQQEEYVEKRKAEIEVAEKAARAEIRAEYEHKDMSELVEILAQLNVNMKALMDALSAKRAIFVYFTLHDADHNRICPSVEAVRENFQADTIRYFAENIEAAFALAVRADLPFVSADVSEPPGQPTSVTTSEQATTPSSPGSSATSTRRKSSKRSTSPAGGKPRKKD